MRPADWLPLAALAALASDARADGADCRLVDVDFVPGELPPREPMTTTLQIVAWLEDAAGRYIDTVFITDETGRYGLGNRPGRFDFNSGPMWPYGRRTTLFPVWARRHGLEFAEVEFQDRNESNLSHAVADSSRELHYCLPLHRSEAMWQTADAGSCASQVYTDKGRFSTRKSLYPPRSDLARDAGRDALDVARFAEVNPFDAISQASPAMGVPARFAWSIPPALPPGDYVLWVETAREFDHNATYSTTAFPAPSIASYLDWGKPYRGQPSVLYRVPIAIGWSPTSGTTASYAGYGDPTGADGRLRAPDATITIDVPGSGAQRLALTSGGYRVRAVAHPEPDFAPPGAVADLALADVTDHSATIAFVAPGDDGLAGRIAAYEVRLQVGADITEATFDAAPRVAARVAVADPGTRHELVLSDLLFETDYTVAIRAVDDCRNASPIQTLHVRTGARAQGTVDACFVATAAYGSALANDVGLLRQFRDSALRRSVLGELAVEAYYTFGPALSGAVGESDLLRATARAVIDPLVAWIRTFRP